MTRTDKVGSQQGTTSRVSGRKDPSLAVYCLSSCIFLADQISCRFYVGSVYRMRSLAVSGFSFMYFRTVGLFRSDTLRF